MLAPEHPRATAIRQARVNNLAQDVLDVLPITDNIYHHLAFTRPLVDALVDEIHRDLPTGRVLVIGTNELLGQVLIELGYEVDLWVINGLPLSEGLQRHASRSGSLDELLAAPASHQADAILAPYVAEAATLEPADLLRTLKRHLKPAGRVIVASRQPAELRRRVLRSLRRVRATTRPDDAFPPSPTWPTLAANRLLTIGDLALAGDGQFRVVRAGMVIDHRAFMATEALVAWKWLMKDVIHLAKVVVPSFRDCAMVTFALDV